MFESLLVPLDGSRFSEQSIPTAAALAGESGAALHLVHVHVPHVPDQLISHTQFQYEGIDLDDYDRKHRQEESQYLDRVAASIADVVEGELDTTVLEGPVTEAINQFAHDAHADLIVVASHGHTGVERLWLGSVAEALARETTQPLLVLRPEPGDDRVLGPMHFHNILVCLDGSKEGEAVLEPLRALGQMGARVSLLHVVSQGVMFGARSFPLPLDRRDVVMERADDYLQNLAWSLEDDCGPVATHVEEASDPARGILRVVEELDADLIALTTHGHGGLRRALMGSVADKVLRGAQRPVLLKKPD